MRHPSISFVVAVMLIAAIPPASATPIILLAENDLETLADVSITDTTTPGTPPIAVIPDARGRYLIGTCGTVCPMSGTYTTDDQGDSFRLTVPAGADPEAGNVYLTDFTSAGGDESAAEDDETLLIPTFGILGPGTPVDYWTVIINSPKEGAGDTSMENGGGGDGEPSPVPEPNALLLLTTGAAGFAVTRIQLRRRVTCVSRLL